MNNKITCFSRLCAAVALGIAVSAAIEFRSGRGSELTIVKNGPDRLPLAKPRKCHSTSESISGTADHPWFVQGKGWVEARNLQPGDELVGPGGNRLIVQSTTTRQAVAPTYNFEVARNHTYFVSSDGDAPALVHNMSRRLPRRSRPNKAGANNLRERARQAEGKREVADTLNIGKDTDILEVPKIDDYLADDATFTRTIQQMERNIPGADVREGWWQKDIGVFTDARKLLPKILAMPHFRNDVPGALFEALDTSIKRHSKRSGAKPHHLEKFYSGFPETLGSTITFNGIQIIRNPAGGISHFLVVNPADGRVFGRF